MSTTTSTHNRTIFPRTLAALLVLSALQTFSPSAFSYDRAAAISADIANGDGANPLVVAHRADWRHAPENSLRAIRAAIDLGVDIVEIDVRRTKDNHYVIIHDTTLDRTTDGKGKVSDYTLAELRKLRLRAATGHIEADRLPTLEEALDATRGRAVINLDKSDTHLAAIYEIVQRANALDYAIFNIERTRAEVEAATPGLLAKIKYMIVVNDARPDALALVRDYLASDTPPAIVQLVSAREDSPLFAMIPEIRAKNIRVWLNSLWPEHNGGHDDERALTDPEGSYGWLVEHGANIIQTDRPALLINYLRATNRRR